MKTIISLSPEVHIPRVGSHHWGPTWRTCHVPHSNARLQTLNLEYLTDSDPRFKLACLELIDRKHAYTRPAAKALVPRGSSTSLHHSPRARDPSCVVQRFVSECQVPARAVSWNSDLPPHRTLTSQLRERLFEHPIPHAYHIFRTWALEVITAIFALGLIIAIATILAFYHGSPVPNWGATANINLNALLAFLSTMLRASLVIIVSQVISQRKWEWYGMKQARPLSNLQQFDQGSRGSLGALLLIPTVLWEDFVTLAAAVVIVLSFLVGPFVQQASRVVECSFASHNQNASLPFAHWVPRQGGITPGGRGFDSTPAPDLLVAITSSVTSPDSIENQITPICSTGNCTFPNDNREGFEDRQLRELRLMSTVGVCSKCTDVTTLISLNNRDYPLCSDYSLPNGDEATLCWDNTMPRIASIRPTFNLSWMGDLLTEDVRIKSRWAYVNATFVAVSPKNESFASVCSIYPCLRTYTASIENNRLVEDEVGSKPMQIECDSNYWIENVGVQVNANSSDSCNLTAIADPCRIDGRNFEPAEPATVYSNTTSLSLYDFTDRGGPDPYQYTSKNVSAPEQCIYRQSGRFVSVISQVLSVEIFNGSCQWMQQIPFCTREGGIAKTDRKNMLNDVGVGAVLGALFNDGIMNFENTTRWFDSFATAMTNKFRSEYGSAVAWKGLGNQGSWEYPDQDVVKGLAWQTTVCVSMHIGWLVLPAYLTFMTIALSIWTIILNRQHRHTIPVWKDNILPPIFHHQRIETQDAEPPLKPKTQQSREASTDNMEETRHPMEANEMEKISRNIQIKFRWSESTGSAAGDEDCSTSTALQQESIPLKHREPSVAKRSSDDLQEEEAENH